MSALTSWRVREWNRLSPEVLRRLQRRDGWGPAPTPPRYLGPKEENRFAHETYYVQRSVILS